MTTRTKHHYRPQTVIIEKESKTMKTIREMLENNYTVVIESMFGDMEITKEDLEILDIEEYESNSELVSIDEVKKIAHFEEIENGQYDL